VVLCSLLLFFFSLLKNLDFSNIFLNRQAGMGEGSLTISTALSLDEPEVDEDLVFRTLGVNLLETLVLKELLPLMSILFHLAL